MPRTHRHRLREELLNSDSEFRNVTNTAQHQCVQRHAQMTRVVGAALDSFPPLPRKLPPFAYVIYAPALHTGGSAL